MDLGAGMKAKSSEPWNTMASGWGRRLVRSLFLAVLSALWMGAAPLAPRPAGAQELGVPEGRIILTISGRIENTNGKGVAEFDRAARVETAVHVIAHEDQAVVVAQRKGFYEFFERLPFAMNVANRVEHESD